eukprot:g17393.t1
MGTVELDSDDDVQVQALPTPAARTTPPPTAEGGSTSSRKRKERVEAKPAAALPYGWIRKQSKSKKGAYYYANILTGKTQVQRPGPRSKETRVGAGAEGTKEVKKMAPEEVRQRQAEFEAAEAELEAAKRQAAERRAAQKAVVEAEPVEHSEEAETDLAKWKAQEEQREKREVQLKTMPNASDLPPVPPVLEPCLDILKDDKWVERHSLSAGQQRWTLGRAVGEVDFVMNHPSISRQHAALSRGNNDGTFIWGDKSSDGKAVDVAGQMHWAVTVKNMHVKKHKHHATSFMERFDARSSDEEDADVFLEQENHSHSKFHKTLTKILDVATDCSNMEHLPNLHFVLGDDMHVSLPPSAYIMKVQMPRLKEDPNSQAEDSEMRSATSENADANLEEDDDDEASDDAKAVGSTRFRMARLDLTQFLLNSSTLCMPAIVPLDRETQKGTLLVIGGPLFEKCSRFRGYSQVFAIYLGRMIRAEKIKQRHSAELSEMSATLKLREISLDEIRYPHWAKYIDDL